jgi:excisionase family DNA binding protein
MANLLGMTDAAARLGIHYLTLRRWCEAGKIPHIRDSAGRRLFEEELIERLVRERRAQQERR